MNDEQTVPAVAGPLDGPVRRLLSAWAEKSGVQFVSRSYGPRTTGTVSRDDLEALIAASIKQAREQCAAESAPERIPYSDEEWRVRCEIRDAILGD